ncbi:hypothetical protein cce_3837 [Crocosphaera subtropica ATCC 51142]|uniref:Uncharacterized protein n=1 Tax=Crocosphaera subtropica (strain ATCC 51142 / BH68) TaxID=43989 RepID=B1WP06_CROS5|nr:hypothetical protein [Crocosphaera subtropica]ACB53185.1 hypothetical protein cce_3837 [Crocosphaera subtropica ATCC 51142]
MIDRFGRSFHFYQTFFWIAQLEITELFGTIEYEDEYDYKQQRFQLSI